MNNLNYAVIGNCRSAALVSDKGSIDWFCLPDFDSASVFAKILDNEKGGSFSITVEDHYRISQKYLPFTNVLRTEYKAEEGSFEVIDFMPRYKINDQDYFTPSEIFRYIRLLSGAPSFSVIYDPKLNYARDEVSHTKEYDHLRTYSVEWPTDCIYLYSSFDFNDILSSKKIELTGHEFLMVSYNQKVIKIDIERVYMEYQRTKVYWLNWTNRSKIYQQYTSEINRSLLVLKIMSFQPTGAVLAALTTSIPEIIGEVRNWDYRYCWLRDASMSIDTLLKLGHYQSASRFLNYIMGILKSKHDTFQIMYGIRGEKELIEIDLPHLSGYENSKPVRIGNAAYMQMQNDVFGYLLNVIYQYYKFFPGTLDEIEDMWEIVRNIILTVSTHWEKPDKGIWELRGEEKHHVFSKIMSWVAMDRAAKIARLLSKTHYETTWQEIADDIRADVMTNGWNEKLQTFTQAYDSPDLDASLLLIAEYGFMENDDFKFQKTVLAVKNALFYKGFMYRYMNRDDFGVQTSSFTICTFWLIQALYKIGMTEESRKIFEVLLSCGNHVGLFSEDLDFTTKRLLGNFPQAYSHLALVNTAILFSEEKSDSRHTKP